MGFATLVCHSEIQRVPGNRFSAVAGEKHYCILCRSMADYWKHCNSDIPDTGTFQVWVLVWSDISYYRWDYISIRKNKRADC